MPRSYDRRPLRLVAEGGGALVADPLPHGDGAAQLRAADELTLVEHLGEHPVASARFGALLPGFRRIGDLRCAAPPARLAELLPASG
ncbi:hypothetical protein [Nonomuraea rubra]|uniref:Uncharacterized protein n=1 Tax=Nonomuraea rubra TaxID=46180 RepID=A0A7X0U3R4_9ACTN|nr:hypothetical protein [Nonomuraea rubra]MBB6553769.1 hypothetical protein [Nonomuraea rubra]